MFIGLNNAITGLTQDQLSKTINSLFSKNEQGVWYDPSDFSTMFQDAAGTTPVTAVEQPVGLMLDKSKGLVLGPELVTNGTFDTDISGWAASPGGSGSWVSGEMVVRATATNAVQGMYIPITCVVGKAYLARIELKTVSGPNKYARVSTTTNPSNLISSLNNELFVVGANTLTFVATQTTHYLHVSVFTTGQSVTVDNISVRELPGNHAYQPASTSRPVLSARVNQYVGTATLATQNVTTLAATYTLRFEGTGSITLSGTATGTYSAGTHSVVCTAGTLTSTVTGTVTNADIRVDNVGVGLPVYQRVTTSTDYDTVSYPFFLRFDGVDDYLVTRSIDFTATDKMTVFAGVRKLSDAATGVVGELSASSGAAFGVFVMAGPWSPVSKRFTFNNNGNAGAVAEAATTSTSFNAPITSILTGLGDISGDSSILRVNGVQVASSAADQGAGNYGNYPLYIGRRGGASIPFNGQLYGLVIRGALSSTGEIQGSESYMNLHTGAY